MKNGILRFTVEKERKSTWNATAYNGRFGVMAAVAPQKQQCKFAREYPAGSSVGAATTPSRWDVVGKFCFCYPQDLGNCKQKTLSKKF